MEETFVPSVTHTNSIDASESYSLTCFIKLLGLYLDATKRTSLTELHPSDVFHPKLLHFNLSPRISSLVVQKHFHGG